MPLPAWAAAAIPSAISGIAGLFGQRSSNKANQREAAKNRAWQSAEADTNRSFQERMRNTEWQSAVADMQAAGINPALAYAQGGASSPSGSMGGGATAAPQGNEVSSAIQAMTAQKSLQLLDAQTDEQRAKAQTAAAQSRIEMERSRYLLPHLRGTANGRSAPPLLWDLLDSEIKAARAGASNMEALTARNQALASIAGPMATLSDQMGTLLPILGGAAAAAGPAGGLARAFMRRRYRK